MPLPRVPTKVPLSSSTVKTLAIAGAGIGLAVVGYLVYRRYNNNNKRQLVYSRGNPSGNGGENLPVLQAALSRGRKEKLKQLLKADHVHIQDSDYVEEVIDNLILGGVSELQVIADFDRTLAGLTHEGNPVPSCHAVIENAPGLPDWFQDKTHKRRDYYLAIEIDPNMTRDEKYPFMVEWWTKAHDFLVSCSLRKEQVVQSVRQANLYLREGSKEMMKLLFEHDVPFLIFSAGVGDIIEECLKLRYELYENIKIVANWMDFNHAGDLVGFKGENIHIYNKNIHAIEHSSYFEDIRTRHNVILLGDSLGDLDIAEGVIVKENLLTIGFLNNHFEEALPEYKKKYDIVLVNDPTMDLLNSLLENILTG